MFAAIGEELGLVGALAVLACYLVIAERGLRIAATAQDDFRALLAAGLTLVIGVQAAIIAGGNLKLIPLTGITLPFISYGGVSLLANALVVGLLLALSDRGVEPPRAAVAAAPGVPLGGSGAAMKLPIGRHLAPPGELVGVADPRPACVQLGESRCAADRALGAGVSPSLGLVYVMSLAT